MGVIAPAEAHLLGVEVDEAVVGDGALAGVAPEVSDDVGGVGRMGLTGPCAPSDF